MTYIEAAEDGFGRANAYYLLVWAFVSIVVLTAFFETRSISNEKAQVERVIGLQERLVPLVEQVTSSMNRVVITGPSFDTEGEALADLRANSARATQLLLSLSGKIADRRDLSVDQRVALNAAINPLLTLLFFNDATMEESGLVLIPDKPGLSLVEHKVGTIGVASSVPALRIQDAVRLLWLSSIPMRDIIAAREELLRMSTFETEEDIAGLTADLSAFRQRASTWTEREKASALWNAWLKSFPSGDGTAEDKLNRFAIEQMRLRDPFDSLNEAFAVLASNQSRASGRQSNIELPGLSTPVRLSDALIILPWALAFCFGAIYVYTARGIRYATKAALPTGKVVGNIPGYFAAHNVNHWVGAFVAAIFLIAPVAIIGILPFLAPFSSFDVPWVFWTYFGGIAVTGLLVLSLFVQATRVIELLKQGIGTAEI